MKIHFENLDELISACVATTDHFERKLARAIRQNRPRRNYDAQIDAFKRLADTANCEKRLIEAQES